MNTGSSKPLNYYDWRRAVGAGIPDYQRYFDRVTAGEDPVPERRYTRAEVEAALNQAANLVESAHDGYEDSDTIALDDAVSLVVKATGYLLDKPAARLDEIIPACYADVELDEGDFGNTGLDDPLPERGSKEWNRALVDRVLGWIS